MKIVFWVGLLGILLSSPQKAQSQETQISSMGAIIVLDGIKYPQTQAGLQAAVDAVPLGAKGQAGMIIVPPKTMIDINSCKTDSEGTYGILVGGFNGLKIYGYGATIHLVANIPCRALELRSSQDVTVEGFQFTNANPLVGTAISIRRPRDRDAGWPAVNNLVLHNQIGTAATNGFSVGIEIGVSGEGQVSENHIEGNVVSNCGAGIQQDGAETETNLYVHNTVQSYTVANAVLWNMIGHSATVIAPTSGGMAVGLTHFQIGANFRNLVLINPHFEVSQNGSARDDAAVAINWNAVESQGAFVEVVGGTISDFRPSGTHIFINLANAGTGGAILLDNTVLYRAGGNANIAFQPSGGVTMFRRQGVWTNIATTGLSSDATRYVSEIGSDVSGYRVWEFSNGARIGDEGTQSTTMLFSTPSSYGGVPVNHLRVGDGFLQTLSGLKVEPDIDDTGAIGAPGRKYANAYFSAITSPNLITPTIGRGTPLSRYARYVAVLSPKQVAAHMCAAQSFAVAGVVAADILIGVSKPSEQPGLTLSPGHVSGNDTATLNFCNNTGSPIKPTADEAYSFVLVQ